MSELKEQKNKQKDFFKVPVNREGEPKVMFIKNM